VHELVEEMVMMTVRMEEHVQTMGRQAANVVFPEVIVSVIANASWWETVQYLLSNLR
jgi:hypothetical protein